MATTGKSNGHLGISHPFGARHGTPVVGQGNEQTQQSLADRVYGAKKDPLTTALARVAGRAAARAHVR